MNHDLELRRNFVPLEINNSGIRLVCIHPIGGSIYSYAEMVSEMNERPSTYGIQAPIGAESIRNFSSLEELAVSYAALLSDFDQGPLFLCGWSLGGLIATEVARLLYDSGRDVSGIILISTKASLSDNEGSAGNEDTESWILREYISMLSSELDPFDFVRERIGDSKISILRDAYYLARRQGNKFLPFNESDEKVLWRFDFFRSQLIARLSYVPRDTNIPTLYISPRDESGALPFGPSGLRNTVFEEVPGNHVTSMRKPNLVHTSRAVEKFIFGK